MNRLFCLAHFCEIHGPLTILCTQKQTVSPWRGSQLVQCDACSLILPDHAALVVSDPESNPNGSFEPQEGTSIQQSQYVSTKYPASQQIYTSLMKLVMKCLSVETTADPLKPHFFGDAVSGFCLVKVFSIRDVHARGGERKYALMVVSDSELTVIENWGVSAAYFSEIISAMQQSVEKRHESSGGGGLVENERYLRRSKNTPRLLVELTGDAQIFVKLHLMATELLGDMA